MAEKLNKKRMSIISSSKGVKDFSTSSRFTQLVWWTNIFFLVVCLAGVTQFLKISFLSGLIIGVGFAAFLLYQRTKYVEQSLKHARIINFVILFATILVVSYYLWGSLLRGRTLNIAEYTVVLFFLLGLAAVGILLRMADADNLSKQDKEVRIRHIMSGPSLFLSFCVAAILTDLSLILFFILKSGEGVGFVYQKFLQRGIIPPICLVLFYWETVLLLGKYYLGRRTLAILPANKLDDNELILLWREYRKAQKTKATQEFLVKKFVEQAWQANETFYFFPRYINWAIPILGFIGTVLGISLAAGEIGNLVGSANINIGDSINAAMEPLGIAFDTTLIALSLSVFLAFIYTLLQRWEEQRFLFLEEHITRIK